MKNVIASIIIFITMTIIIVFSINYLNKICVKLEKANDNIERQLEKEQWDDAYKVSVSLIDEWNDDSYIVSIFTNHAEIDNINNELWKLSQYVKCRNKDESLASIHVIKFLLKHIVNMEKINVQNIF